MTPETIAAITASVVIPVLTAIGKQWLERKKQEVDARIKHESDERMKEKDAYERWKEHWEVMVKNFEERIDFLENELKETRKELRAVHIENATMVAQLADCRRRMKAAGIPNGE